MPALSCPFCRQSFLVSRDEVGGAVACPHCQQRLTLQRRKRRDWRTQPPPMARSTPAPEVGAYPEALPLASSAPVQFFTTGDWLGAASLLTGACAFLTLLLPCFWSLALPLSGLGAGLGAVGYLAAAPGRDRTLPGFGSLRLAQLGLFAGLGLVLLSGAVTLHAQWQILQATAELERSLDQLRRY